MEVFFKGESVLTTRGKIGVVYSDFNEINNIPAPVDVKLGRDIYKIFSNKLFKLRECTPVKITYEVFDDSRLELSTVVFLPKGFNLFDVSDNMTLVGKTTQFFEAATGINYNEVVIKSIRLI